MSSPCRRTFAWHLTSTLVLVVGLNACGNGNEPPEPASIALDPASVSFTALGETQQVSPTVLDGQGNAMPDVAVSWSTSDAAIATVTSEGVVTAQGPGSTQLTASAGSVTATAQIQVTQTPSQMRKIAGDGQIGTPGQPVAIPPALVVEDANGNPIAGVAVLFEVVSGGGSVTGGSASTNSNGIAQVGSWTLGGSGSNTLRATATGLTISGNPVTFTVTGVSAFHLEVRFLGNPTAAQLQAFAEAEARWESLVVGDLENVQLTAEPGDCGSGSPAIDEIVDDVLILVTLETIDGPGNVLGSAGPCFIRLGNNTPVLGAMRLDTADLEDVEAAGLLSQVVLHEMGHVLGFGSLWELDGFLADPSLPEGSGNNDPHFTGPRAIAAFDQIGGAAYAGGKVPVENTGGRGTADSHWRESVFANELMTGFINPAQNPLSRVTLASLGDLGLVVNEQGADPFSLSLALRATFATPSLHLGDDILRVPLRRVDAAGRVRSVLQR